MVLIFQDIENTERVEAAGIEPAISPLRQPLSIHKTRRVQNIYKTLLCM